MKKILYFLVLLFCTSCTTTYMIGNIHVYDENYNEIKTYNNITIDNDMFKSHGLNFYDIKSGNYVYLSQSTIYSITYIQIVETASIIEVPETNRDYLSNVYKHW